MVEWVLGLGIARFAFWANRNCEYALAFTCYELYSIILITQKMHHVIYQLRAMVQEVQTLVFFFR